MAIRQVTPTQHYIHDTWADRFDMGAPVYRHCCPLVIADAYSAQPAHGRRQLNASGALLPVPVISDLLSAVLASFKTN